MTIGERIKALRKKQGLTQEKLADCLCVTYQAVSKWECGASCPDLSLIVPLAKLLHVTTDELLGMDASEEDARKQEYEVLYATAHHPGQLEIARQAARDYPGELKYVKWQANCQYMDAFEHYTTQEAFYEDLEKALKLERVVFENTDDETLKNSALAGIVMNLSGLHRNDEAVRYAEQYPDAPVLDKKTVMGWALTGEEKERHSQKILMEHLDGMLWILIEKADPQNPNLKRMESLDCAEGLIHMLFPGGEYNRYYDELFLIFIYKAIIYANHAPEKAADALKQARSYAQAFDDLFMREPAAIPYRSPFFNLLNYDSADLLLYGSLEENRLTDRFRWWLSGACFDVIREREDFKAFLAE